MHINELTFILTSQELFRNQVGGVLVSVACRPRDISIFAADGTTLQSELHLAVPVEADRLVYDADDVEVAMTTDLCNLRAAVLEAAVATNVHQNLSCQTADLIPKQSLPHARRGRRRRFRTRAGARSWRRVRAVVGGSVLAGSSAIVCAPLHLVAAEMYMPAIARALRDGNFAKTFAVN